MHSLLQEHTVKKNNKHVSNYIWAVVLKGLSLILMDSFESKLPGYLDFAGLDLGWGGIGWGHVGLIWEIFLD